MDFAKHALILATVEALRKHGNGTGKTHLQKALFLLECLDPRRVPFRFVLYKHGPYSFDLESELEEMKSYAAISATPVYDYGMDLRPGDMATYVREKSPLKRETARMIERVCRFVRLKTVSELERIATAAWLRKRNRVRARSRVAEHLHELKPHISTDEAARADEELLKLLRPPRKQGRRTS